VAAADARKGFCLCRKPRPPKSKNCAWGLDLRANNAQYWGLDPHRPREENRNVLKAHLEGEFGQGFSGTDPACFPYERWNIIRAHGGEPQK